MNARVRLLSSKKRSAWTAITDANSRLEAVIARKIIVRSASMRIGSIAVNRTFAMTERAPTTKDVQAAWLRFNGMHNFGEKPVLRLPLNPPMSVFDVVVNNDPQEPVAMRHCVIQIERGQINGEPAERLVGSVPGTDISVVLETRIRR
jgi:hypothetical protein